MAKVITDDKYYKEIAELARERNPSAQGRTFLPSELFIATRDAMDCEWDAGHSQGYAQGEEYGYNNGKAEGISEGVAQGIEQGRTEGYSSGKADGLSEGIEQGRAEGIEQGIELGKKSAYDEFWDSVQDYGNRDYYAYAFAGPIIGSYFMYLQSKGEVVKPKYPIVIREGRTTGTGFMYQFNRGYDNDDAVDLTEFCKMVDFSAVTYVDQFFTSARATNITADFSNATSLNYTFAHLNGGYMPSITLKITEKCTNLKTAFQYTNQLGNLIFMEGSVIATDIDISATLKLSKTSIISVMEHLSPSTSGKTVSFSEFAVNRGFETAANSHNGSTSEEWLALVNSRPNWTISLI